MVQSHIKYLRTFLMISCILGALQAGLGQRLGRAAKKDFEKREDSLKRYAYDIVFAEESSDRFRSDSFFVKSLVRALKQNNSFYYPFDSLQTISHIYAPDSSFRIFTWQLKKDEYVYMQQGAIQMRTPDGSLKLYGLHDASMFTRNPLDSIRNVNNWIGAIYYRIVLKTFQNRKYYTLLGFDDFTISSTKKWMEILTFNERGEPVFGGPYVSFKEDSAKKPTQLRFNIEYRKEASVRFNYDPELDMIIYDNLISETNEPDKKDSYIPDGDFEGFRWKEGQWVHVDKVFDYRLKDGDYPREKLILDNNGKADEQKLLDQSIKNMQKADSASKPPKKYGI